MVESQRNYDEISLCILSFERGFVTEASTDDELSKLLRIHSFILHPEKFIPSRKITLANG